MRRRVALLVIALCASACSATTPGAPAWREVATTSTGPGPRWGQVAVHDARRDRMVIFGGENAGTQTNEVWAFDLAAETWSRIDTGPGPSPRTDLAGVLDPARDRLVVIGGRVGLATSIGEVWALDLQARTWTQLPSGPPARHDVPAATDGTRIWVFGGAGELFQSLEDLWELDLATDTWRMLPSGTEHPPARTSSAMAYADGAVWLHGGHDVSMAQHDTWKYDLATSRWTRVDPPGNTVAAAHFGYAWDETCGALYVTSGDNLDNLDVARTDALVVRGTPRYAHIPASVLAPPRDHPSMILDPVRRELVLFGGGTIGDGLGTLGDTWVYPLGACP